MFGKWVSFSIIVVILGLCLVALWICSFLMEIHDPLKTRAEQALHKQSLLADFCDPEDKENVSCTAVVSSAYGTIKIPLLLRQKEGSGAEGEDKLLVWKWTAYRVPVAQLAMSYYLFLIVWLVFTGIPPRAQRFWHLLPLGLAAFSVVVACFYIFIMSAILKEWCPLCMALHLIDLLLLLGLFLLWPVGRRAIAREAEGTKGSGLARRHVLATIACAISVSMVSFARRHEQANAASAYRRASIMDKRYDRVRQDGAFLYHAFQGTRRVEISYRESAPAMGDEQSKNRMVIFSDLQCPVCREFEIWFSKNILPMWKEQIKITFLHFPLCTDCNPTQSGSERYPHGIHPHACIAAYAAETARLQGGARAFWRMHDTILRNQREMSSADFGEENLFQYAKEIGLDVQRFQADLKGEQVRNAVAQDIQVARALGVRATPTVFLNGRKLEGIQRSSASFWKIATQVLLEQQDTSVSDRQ